MALTIRRRTPTKAAEYLSEWWPGSLRNTDRDQIGIPTGFTSESAFALLRRAATRPAREILKLLDAAIFNLIIGNADAHAKNFSLLHSAGNGGGAITLAPLYDLLSTVLYPNLHVKLAMKIGGKAVLEDIESRHWNGSQPRPDSARPSCERGSDNCATPSLPRLMANLLWHCHRLLTSRWSNHWFANAP
jgi:hypothetical protein